MPSAARWRVPKRSVWIVVSASGRSAPAARIVSPRMITAPSWRAVRGAKIVRSRSADRSPWIITPGLGDLLEAGLALDHDERAVALRRQAAGGPRDLGRDVLGGPRLGRRQEPAERADAADALERPPQLGLEDDDEGEQADDGAGLEDLGQQAQVERDRPARRRRTAR